MFEPNRCRAEAMVEIENRRRESAVIGDGHAKERRAAYSIGRHLWFIEGWLRAVRSIASIPERPWEWMPPYTLLGTSYSSAPLELFSEIDDALLTLVQAKAVDAAVLVELHRALDAASEKCISIADLAEHNQRDELCELYWNASYDLYCAIRLQRQFLNRQGQLLNPWRQFGDLLGEAVNWFVGQIDPAANPELMTALLKLGERLLPSGALYELESLYDSVVSDGIRFQGVNRSQQMLSLLFEADARAAELFAEAATEDPYLILDDEQEVLIIFGTIIPFDVFREANAAGGLDVLRVLIRDPGRFIVAQDVIERSGRTVEPCQLYAYVTRLRCVINRTESSWPGRFRVGDICRRAEMAFVKPQRTKRMRPQNEAKVPAGPVYKLDLRPDQVRHIERLQG